MKHKWEVEGPLASTIGDYDIEIWGVTKVGEVGFWQDSKQEAEGLASYLNRIETQRDELVQQLMLVLIRWSWGVDEKTSPASIHARELLAGILERKT